MPLSVSSLCLSYSPLLILLFLCSEPANQAGVCWGAPVHGPCHIGHLSSLRWHGERFLLRASISSLRNVLPRGVRPLFFFNSFVSEEFFISIVSPFFSLVSDFFKVQDFCLLALPPLPVVDRLVPAALPNVLRLPVSLSAFTPVPVSLSPFLSRPSSFPSSSRFCCLLSVKASPFFAPSGLLFSLFVIQANSAFARAASRSLSPCLPVSFSCYLRFSIPPFPGLLSETREATRGGRVAGEKRGKCGQTICRSSPVSMKRPSASSQVTRRVQTVSKSGSRNSTF